MPKVEVTCQLNGSVRPIRLWWNGTRLTISEWEPRHAGASSWAGDVRTLDGQKFRMSFSKSRGWQIQPMPT